MIILLFNQKPTKEQLAKAAEEFADYIKVVVDTDKGIMAMGGKLHTDGEQLLLENGSKQENLWGGGLDLVSKKIDCTALSNIRPGQGNNSMEILDLETRKRFLKIIKKYFAGYEY